MLMLTACLFIAALATPAEAGTDRVSGNAAPSADKTVARAYASMALGIAGPILIGSALANQGGGGFGGWLMVGGILVGPSTGQFYAEAYAYGMLDTGLRVGSILLMAAGMLPDSPVAGEGVGLGLYLVSLGAFAAGTVHSFIDTRSAVHRYRNRVREERFGFTPTLAPAQGRVQPGALAWMRF